MREATKEEEEIAFHQAIMAIAEWGIKILTQDTCWWRPKRKDKTND